MKKLLTIFLAVMFLSGMLVVGKALALSFTAENEHRFMIDGKSYISEVEVDDGGESTVSELRGMFRVSTLYDDDADGQPSIHARGDDDKYFDIRFGGLRSEVNSEAGGDPGYYSGGWAELWENDTDLYADNIDDTGSKTFGATDFAENLTSGENRLAMSFADVFSVDDSDYSFRVSADEDTIDVDSLTVFDRIESLGFLNITGGSWMNLFNSDVYRDGTDVRLSGDASFEELLESEWLVYQSDSYSAKATAVPEPGTLLLLGTGLLGLAGFAGRMRKSKTE